MQIFTKDYFRGILTAPNQDVKLENNIHLSKKIFTIDCKDLIISMLASKIIYIIIPWDGWQGIGGGTPSPYPPLKSIKNQCLE